MPRLLRSHDILQQFGHPRILYLATPTTGHDLYHTIQQSIPTLPGWGDVLNLHLTDVTVSNFVAIVKTIMCL